MIAVLVSGGVDSFMSACLLKERGEDVVGIHFKTGYGADQDERLHRIAEIAEIPLTVIDCSADFKKKVVDYFVSSYLEGETPNPCVFCNPEIKFGLCADYAFSLGASAVATGHYCRVEREGDRFVLRRGADTHKDQSYFLAFLSQEQLKRAVFPLGGMRKSEVKELARGLSFPFSPQAESQDVCFIRGTDYSDFIEAHAKAGIRPGAIQDKSGNIIGEHRGLHRFTVGQRRGINIPSDRPYYVVSKDSGRNLLTVGRREDLFVGRFQVRRLNWILDVPSGPLDVLVKVRYNHTPAKCRVAPIGDDRAQVMFEQPQFGVAPGQAAVFYFGDTVLGGGIIEREPG